MAENTAAFTVRGIESEDEAETVESELEGIEGIMGAQIDGASGEAEIRFDYDLLSEERIESTVRDMGYDLE